MSHIQLLDAPKRSTTNHSEFQQVTLPTGKTKHISNRITLQFPQVTEVPAANQHVLAYIPWHFDYLNKIPAKYREFFGVVLPHLHKRTTDVHTAMSVAQLPGLIANTPEALDETVTYLSLIMHDSGWSRMSDQEIVDSLSYKGLTHSKTAEGPKSKHDQLGAEVAREILDRYSFDPSLTEAQKDMICTIVRNHTEPHKYKPVAELPIELRLVHDADRLWSFTHENFWQDTVRKDVDPATYAANLDGAIGGYFLTPQGRVRAHELLEERKREVAEHPRSLKGASPSVNVIK